MAKSSSKGLRAPTGSASFKHKCKVFLAELAASSNIAASARKAELSTSAIYDARRKNPEFNRAWQQALCEGYDHLEMELLHRLRTGEVKPASGAKRGVRSFDNGIAFRLLLAHKDSVGRQRALRDSQDSEAIIRSIDAKLEKIRERKAIAKAMPDETVPDEAGDEA